MALPLGVDAFDKVSDLVLVEGDSPAESRHDPSAADEVRLMLRVDGSGNGKHPAPRAAATGVGVARRDRPHEGLGGEVGNLVGIGRAPGEERPDEGNVGAVEGFEVRWDRLRAGRGLVRRGLLSGGFVRGRRWARLLGCLGGGAHE